MTLGSPRGRILATAQALLLVTILYNAAEGVVAVWAGLAAGSITLVSFGADSALEVAAASVILWGLVARDRDKQESLERRAVPFVGWTFLALAAAIVFQSGWAFAGADGANESLRGIVLAVISLTLMPALALWKLRTAARGNVLALAKEAKETLACSYLSLVLLTGLTANALLGWWWLDPLAALVLTPWLLKEGLECIRSEQGGGVGPLCWCRGCWYGVRACTLPCCSPA